MKLIQKVRVRNRLGLHTRPATAIVQMLQGCKSDVSFSCSGETINAKSLLSILMLAATRNTQITVTVEGDDDDALDVMQALVQGFATAFGE